MDERLDLCAKGVEENVNQIKPIEPVECNDGFLKESSTMFEYYKGVAENEFKTIANYYAMDSITYEQYDSLQLIVDRVEEEQKLVNDKFLEAQKEFAKQCGFKLVQPN